MPKFQTRRLVPHSADDMFRLVADVERYPEFVPLCEHLVVTERSPVPQGENLQARMTVGHKALRETFTTSVTLDSTERLITVSYIDGPVRYLNNRWKFEASGKDASHIDFFIDYEFRSVLLGALLGGVFDKAFRTFTRAFEDRADAIYGRNAPVS